MSETEHAENETEHAAEETNPPADETPEAVDGEIPQPQPLYRMLIASSAKWSNHAAIERALANWWADNQHRYGTLVVGDTPIGGEPMAIQVWSSWGMPVEIHHADRVSASERDRGMVASGIDVAFVFIEDQSPGASRVRDLAVAAGIPVIEYQVTHHVPVRTWDSQ